MKKILNVSAVLGLTLSSAILSSVNFKNPLKTNTPQIASNNFLKSPKYIDVLNKGKFQRNVVSRYANVVGKPVNYDENLDKFQEISGNKRNTWLGHKNSLVSEINIRDLGYTSKIDFLQDYNEVEVTYNYGYNFTNDGNNNWQNGSDGVNIGAPDRESKIISLNNNEVDFVVVDKEFKHTRSSMHRAKMTLKGKWTSAYEYNITFNSEVSLDYNTWSTYDHAAYSAFMFNETSLT